MLLADTLSRAYSEDYERSATESEVECIHATHFLPFPDDQLKELQRETACDPTLKFELSPLVKGKTVRIMPLPHDKSQTWFKAEIEELADVRSYKVKTEDGRILCRNRRHLCRSREPFYSSQPSEAPVALQPPDMAASPEKLQGP
ncbi:unnamed protein product, partial [Porites lobata]